MTQEENIRVHLVTVIERDVCSIVVVLCCSLSASVSLLFFLLVLPGLNQLLVLPDAAGVVFRASDNRVAFVVESAREDFVLVTLAWICTQTLKLGTIFSGPYTARLVATCRHYLVTLRVKRDLTDLILMALKDRGARSREDIVDSSHSICTCRGKLISRLVKACVEHFISVTAELFYQLATTHVPQSSCSIDRAGDAVVASEVELSTTQLGSVAG